MMQINADYTIIDHTWLWRADHDVGGLVYDRKNPVDHGLVVNGDNVTGYGLFSEHSLDDLLVWNGNGGKAYFYQSEMPYDVTQEEYGTKVGYRVGDNVTSHEAYGIGVYTFFRDYTVSPDSGIAVPSAPGVTVTNALGVKLDGLGGLQHIINDKGSGTDEFTPLTYYCNWNNEEVVFLQ